MRKKVILGTILALLLSLMLLFTGCMEEDPGYAIVVDEDGNELIIDEATGAMVTITQSHHEIHEGSVFTYVDTVDLAMNNVRDIQITTPNTAEWANFTFSISSESELDWYLYENVTINVAGAGIVEENANRNSAHVATTMLAVIDNATVANANADTAVAGATEIYHATIGAGKDDGFHEHGHEIILEQNQDYTLRLVAIAAGYVSYHIDWYEHVSN